MPQGRHEAARAECGLCRWVGVLGGGVGVRRGEGGGAPAKELIAQLGRA